MGRLILALFIYAPLGMVALGLWRSAAHGTSFFAKGEAFAKRNKCIVEERFVALLDQRFREQQQAAALALAATAALFLPLSLVDDGQPLVTLFPLIIASTTLVRSLHICWQSARSAGPEPGTSRVARLRSVATGDLVSPLLRGTAWMTGLITAAAALTAFFGDVSEPWVWVLGTTAALVLGCVLIVEVTARWVTAQPEQAEDSAHLYWQDAFRADALGAAYLASALAAGLAMMVLWPRAFELPVWTGFVPIAGTFFLAVPASYFGRFHYRRRLWGWLGPDEVVLPGSTLVPR